MLKVCNVPEINTHEEESVNFYREKRSVVRGCFRGNSLPFVFFFGHPKTKTMQIADCNCRLHTVQTLQTEYFFSDTSFRIYF